MMNDCLDGVLEKLTKEKGFSVGEQMEIIGRIPEAKRFYFVVKCDRVSCPSYGYFGAYQYCCDPDLKKYVEYNQIKIDGGIKNG